ncbi:glycosylated lysosomal membrane protein [Nematolebias whitei]|uniref:glycosylated lysosomal membrane protein n=1 Tax=Nematolebias whitei TaxID=451745 RepID=UPI001897FDEC|nr:glycosylated lysosomal membrane protein [Nematolebias whitei]
MAAAEKAQSVEVCVFLLVLIVSSCQSLFYGGKTFKRELSVQLNPDASPSPSGFDLLHVRAVGQNDTLHYLFCSQGAPTLLLVHTNSISSTVKVNWTQFSAPNSSGGLTVEPQSSILYSSAVVFSRLWEYDDVNDTAEATSEFFPPYELQDFSWAHLNLSGTTSLLCGTPPNTINGSLCLQLTAFDSEGRVELWPRLLHSANSSQLEVWLDGLLPRGNHSRFMLELQAVGGAYPLSRVDGRQFIDDEFTPSIFKMFQWVSSMNGSSDILGFVQWKPVAYRKSHPLLEDATPCRHSDPRSQSGKETAASSGLIRAFYLDPAVVGLNVSFGLAGEPFYNKTMFLSWTMLVGVGAPPVDSFSPLVLTIMVVCLGTPVILLLLGGVFVFLYKKRQAATTAYEPIN